ncbi:glycosyltransferase [Sulfitobacter sabulilitoris]|uniref:Glycosyltransferase n=1 Tax=Sulfitobacter sabulilitoris TaxID=2562655 RepID=A0A5S3PZG3_9RHOB|nr:glycosyltransferase [Sulfitobacter sabulilitoris]TMM49326.1 glycosyltransferase [Sulfitobacter sabulilitoris]
MTLRRCHAVVIGRNEGARLVACLTALRGQVARIIYVDSGSRDDSVVQARALGAEVVALDMTRPFTAARARNAGLAMLAQDDAGFVQMIDGDCVLRDGWIEAATAFLVAHPDVAVVCGRRRERHPEASIYNRLCDLEWDTATGEATACGGDALMRLDAVRAVGGYRDDLIAGEEPELCLRLRRAGWRIWRMGAEMTLHDAQMTRFAQWWRRSRRAGHAFAEGAFLHGKAAERHWVAEARRSLFWGVGLPLGIAGLAVALSPWALLLLSIYPAQIMRLARRSRQAGGWPAAAFTVLGKFAEADGALRYHLGRMLRRRSGLIEYK